MILITKNYATLEAWNLDQAHMLASAGAMGLGSEALELRSSVAFELALDFASKKLTLEAELVFIAPTENGFQYGLALSGSWRKSLETFAQELTTEDKNAQALGQDAESLFHRIKDMGMTEKIQLALKGNREERNILLKMTGGTLHTYVLKNPRLTPDEVARILKTPHTTVDMIMTIAQNRDWTKHPGVRQALVKNPKTPLKLVQEHIPFVPDSELYTLAKSEHVREAVSKLARRLLLQKGKSV